jgi:hypothetical protein
MPYTHEHEERKSLERPPRSRDSTCHRDWTTDPLTILDFTERCAVFQCDQWVQCISDSVPFGISSTSLLQWVEFMRSDTHTSRSTLGFTSFDPIHLVVQNRHPENYANPESAI